MKKVRSYELNISTVPHAVELPENAEIVKIDIHPDTNKLRMWAVHRVIDEDETYVERRFRIALDDKGFGDTNQYIGGVYWERGEDDFVHINVIEIID